MTAERNANLNNFLNRLTAPIQKRDREASKQKYQDMTPHPNLQNFETIKWLRSRFNHNVFQRSINTMLPNNGIPVEDEDKVPTRMEKAKEFLNNHCQPSDKFNKIQITPKYLYSNLIMTKIKKLRDIFIEFDEDGSRKLEIGEMVVMFNTNKIPVDEGELVELFFKGKNLKKDEEPYLNFYQFMLFALSKESDQDFRSFMRKLKFKKVEETKKNNQKHNHEEHDENLFLPMNFNLVLDYFNNKGKQRDSQHKIQKAIDIMDDIINPNKKREETKKEESQNEHISENAEVETSKTELNNQEDELEVHNKVNSEMLFEEFRNLFGQKHASENSNNSNRMAKKLLGITTEGEEDSQLPSKRITRKNTPKGKVLPTHISTLNTKTISDKGDEEIRTDRNVPMNYTNFIKNSLYKETATKTSIKLYEKYKSLLLATEETKKKLDLKRNPPISASTHNSNFRTTANATGFNFKAKMMGSSKPNSNDFNSGNIQLNFNQTGNTFANIHNNNLKLKPAPSRSNRSGISKASIPHLPELLMQTKLNKENNDYIPLKLLHELNPNSHNGKKIYDII